jgi:hypothetical protein
MNQDQFDQLFKSLYVEQRLPEFQWLVNEVTQLNPLHVILEIGVMRGGSLKFWEQLVQPDDLVIGVDNDVWTEDLVKSQWDWEHSDRNIKIIIGDSRAKTTIDRVKEALYGRLVDFLFIDGGHGCAPQHNPYVRLPCIDNTPKRDFENYSPFVRSGGLVCVADLGEPCCNDTYEALTGKKKKLVGQDGHGLWWKP